jgi:hypothetical protein
MHRSPKDILRELSSLELEIQDGLQQLEEMLP